MAVLSGRIVDLRLAQATKALARFVRKPLIALVALILVVSVSAISYAVVTGRNPFCFTLTAHGLLVQMTVAELTRESDTILIGTVAQVGPSSQTTSGWIFTGVTVNASEYLKNQTSQAPIQLRIEGGSTTCGGLIVEDQPSFVRGPLVLLFLRMTSYNSPDSYLAVVGGPQGKYTIENGTAWREIQATLYRWTI